MINILMYSVSGSDFVDIFLSGFCLIFVILRAFRYTHYIGDDSQEEPYRLTHMLNIEKQ